MLQSFPSVSEQVATTTAVLQDTFSVNLASIRYIFVPYRICPLGAHIDHQGGHVLGRTISTGTVLAYAPLPEAEIRLASSNFSDSITFPIGADVQPDHWGRYAQAAALTLNQNHQLTKGFLGVSSGTLVGAGLSSSASVGLTYLQALAEVNDISLTNAKLMELDSQLEQTYLGLQNGILDQGTILYGMEHTFVHIDTRNNQIHTIPDPLEAETVGWLIAHSGIARELTIGGGFNQRVTECRKAAQWLEPTAVTLSDVPLELFAEREPYMPNILRRRATHFFSEVARVTAGLQAWQAGEFSHFGSLMNDSCASSIHQYESGQEAIIALHQIVSGASGVYGSRFSGGGYGGCVIGLVDRAQAKTAVTEISKTYRQQFPALADKAAVYWAENGGAA